MHACMQCTYVPHFVIEEVPISSRRGSWLRLAAKGQPASYRGHEGALARPTGWRAGELPIHLKSLRSMRSWVSLSALLLQSSSLQKSTLPPSKALESCMQNTSEQVTPPEDSSEVYVHPNTVVDHWEGFLGCASGVQALVRMPPASKDKNLGSNLNKYFTYLLIFGFLQ